MQVSTLPPELWVIIAGYQEYEFDWVFHVSRTRANWSVLEPVREFVKRRINNSLNILDWWEISVCTRQPHLFRWLCTAYDLPSLDANGDHRLRIARWLVITCQCELLRHFCESVPAPHPEGQTQHIVCTAPKVNPLFTAIDQKNMDSTEILLKWYSQASRPVPLLSPSPKEIPLYKFVNSGSDLEYSKRYTALLAPIYGKTIDWEEHIGVCLKHSERQTLQTIRNTGYIIGWGVRLSSGIPAKSGVGMCISGTDPGSEFLRRCLDDMFTRDQVDLFIELVEPMVLVGCPRDECLKWLLSHVQKANVLMPLIKMLMPKIKYST